MSDKSSKADKADKAEKAEKTESTATSGGKRRADGKRSGGTPDVNRIRSVAASVIWIVAVVAAAILAIGAIMVVLDFNRDNGFVQFVTDAADNLNFLGRLKEFNEGKNGNGPVDVTKTALFNWGIAAIAWIVAGKVVERIVRP